MMMVAMEVWMGVRLVQGGRVGERWMEGGGETGWVGWKKSCHFPTPH